MVLAVYLLLAWVYLSVCAPIEPTKPFEPLVLAFTNAAWSDFCRNWVVQMEKFKTPRYRVVSLDTHGCQACGFPEHDTEQCTVFHSASWHGSKYAEELEWGSAPYIEAMNARLYVVRYHLERGETVWVMDLDIAVFSPLDDILWRTVEFSNKNPGAPHVAWDVAYQQEWPLYQSGADDQVTHHMNGGFWVARPTPSTLYWIDDAIDLTRKLGVVDQEALQLAMLNWPLLVTEPLNIEVTPNGYQWYISRMRMASAAIVHVNWATSTAEKRRRLQELGAWHLDFEPVEECAVVTYTNVHNTVAFGAVLTAAAKCANKLEVPLRIAELPNGDSVEVFWDLESLNVTHGVLSYNHACRKKHVVNACYDDYSRTYPQPSRFVQSQLEWLRLRHVHQDTGTTTREQIEAAMWPGMRLATLEMKEHVIRAFQMDIKN
jgi:hypothetical protein